MPLRLSATGCLRERAFALLFASQLVSTIGDAMASIAVPFAVLSLGGGARDIGLVLGSRAVPLVIFLLVGGVWADRLPRRLVMIGSDAVRMACQAAFATVLVTDAATIPMLMAITFVYGAAEAFFRPALTGLVPQSVSRERLQDAYGLLAMTPAFGMVLGGALGGTVVALVSPAGAIAVDAVSFGIAIVLLALSRIRAMAGQTRGASFLADLRDGWDAFRSRAWLVVAVAGESFYALLVMPAVMVGGPLIARDDLGGAGAWAAIMTCFGLGFLTGGMISTLVHPPRPLVFGYAVTLPFALYFALWTIPAGTPLLMAGSWISGSCIAVCGTLLETTITRQVAPAVRSRVGAFRALGSQVCQPIGFAVIGPVIAALGLSGAMWLAGAAVVGNVALVLGTPAVRALDDGAPGLEPRADVA